MADVLAPGTRDVRPDRIATSSVSTTEAEHSASDDGQATLQAHTKVQVTGNNRTKQSLIGRRGVVLQAGDLGGWHTLELETGETVRIQRNALVVLEQPSGSNVVEQKLSDAAVSIPERVKQQAQRVSIKRPAPLTPPREAGAGHHAAPKRSSVPDKSIKVTRINFNKLDSSALRRYCRHYQLIVGPTTTRDELVNSVAGHFSRQVVNEHQVLASLVHSAGMRRRSLQA